MGRLAIRRVEYFGDLYEYTSPELPDGLVIVEGSNGSGKTTFADLIYFALGGAVSKFSKQGTKQHKEVRKDSNNGVRLTFEINGALHFVTRRFDSPEDVLLASQASHRAEVFPVVRNDGRRIFSDWMLEELGIEVVILFLGTYRGKLNFTDVMRLMYHDQDPDPSRVFKKPDHQNFVSDSRDFRRAVFEILIGKASEKYYETLGNLKLAQAALSECQGQLAAYRSAVERASRGSGRENANADFLREEIAKRETQLERLDLARRQLREKAPSAPSGDVELLSLRQQLATLEVGIAETAQQANNIRAEKTRLHSLEEQLADEVDRIRRIIHAHETLSLFSPDTCPCCLRRVDRAKDHCICGNSVDENAYQRFFYSSDEYLNILKSKQKNVETVRAAYRACELEIGRLTEELSSRQANATKLRSSMARWAGIGGSYSTELERVDDEIVETRVVLERLSGQLELETERDKLEGKANEARLAAERLQQQARALESKAQDDRAEKVAQFERLYTALMRQTLKDVRVARLDADYEPVINDAEYREASSTVARRLMYFVTLLQMSLLDHTVPFPRFLLVDTPETAGIDREDLSRAIGKIPDVLGSSAGLSQVILTTGEGKYPSNLVQFRRITLTDDDRLLKSKGHDHRPPP